MTPLNYHGNIKSLRETLCRTQTYVGQRNYDRDLIHRDIDALGRLITEIDRHRPLGPDGKHGDRHTNTCGCEDATAGWYAPTEDHKQIISELIEALRLTVEYVGTGILHPGEGWSWYDVLVKYAPEIAQHFKDWEDQMGPRREESERLQREQDTYPREEGDVIVLGPETIANRAFTVISYKGVNFRATDSPVAVEPVVNPDDVAIGDVVEVQAEDSSWLILGQAVRDTSGRLGVRLWRSTSLIAWPDLDEAVVRIKKSVEPDPEKVREWTQWLADHGAGRNGVSETLVRAGIAIPK